jgi:hypothetical protein
LKRNLLEGQGKRILWSTIYPNWKIVKVWTRLYCLTMKSNGEPPAYFNWWKEAKIYGIMGLILQKRCHDLFCESKYNLIYTLFGIVFERNWVRLKFWKVAILVKYQLTSVVKILGNNTLLQCCMRYVNSYWHRISFTRLIGFTHENRAGVSLNPAPCHTKFPWPTQLKTSQLS